MKELLGRIREREISLWLEGDSIRYKAAKGAMTKELLNEISLNKQEIIDFLKQAAYLKNADDIMERVQEHQKANIVSFTQQSLWFFDRMNKGNSLYNISNAFYVRGDLNEEVFEKAVNEVAGRHESLRTTFTDEDGMPVRRISDYIDFRMELADLSGTEEEKQQEAAMTIMDDSAQKPFDLEKGPLWKIILIRLGAGKQIMMLTVHHIIADAWSNRIFLLETIALYHSVNRGGESDLAQIRHTYTDFVHWQRKRFSRDEIRQPLAEYWKRKLSGYETLILPTDKERPARQSFSGRTETYLLSGSLRDKIHEICLKKELTMFMFLLAGFQILLSKYSGQSDITIGSVVANRAREELRQMIGFILNTVVIRENLSEEKSVSELLDQVKKTILDMYTYQELPFDLLMEEIKPERHASRTPLFQVMYIHQSVENTFAEESGLKFTGIPIPSKIAPFDIRLSTSETEEGVLCTLDYCDDLYEASTIQSFLVHFEQILNNMCADVLSPLYKISMISAEEQKYLTETLNRTEKEYLFDKTVHQLFEQRVREDGEKIALSFEGNEMSYTELNVRANRLAGLLREKGVSRDVPVGVCLDRSLELIVCLLGVLKAGGAYIPFDTGYPKDRTAYMAANAGAKVLLTDGEHEAMLRDEGLSCICIDTLSEELEKFDGTNLDIQVSMEDLSYIIYTSGSTGEPKGAMNTQLGFLNHKLWMQDVFALDREDIYLQKTPISFDVSVWEIFMPLMTGAKLVLAKPDGHRDPMYLEKLVQEEKITIIHFVPSMLRIFLEEPESESLLSLKRMLVSGEALEYGLMSKARERLGIPIYNAYGPAECADISSMWECDTEYQNHIVPIGKPISNQRIYILDKHQNPVPARVTGEIYLAGPGVGRGYINNRELTKERFLKEKFVPYEALMYKTGDLGRYLDDGNIEYIGRSDFQIKIRGMRLELGEIEKNIQSYSGIKNCAVTVWEKDELTKHLAVYYTQEREVDITALKKELSKHLPEYMVPHYYTLLTELPLNTNGKLDRKALPEPENPGILNRQDSLPPENEVQRKIAEIWKEVLKVDEVGIRDNFFEIGGHSLMLVLVYKKIKEAFTKDFSLIELFTYSTIEAIALFLTENEETDTLDKERILKQKEAKRRNRRLP